MAKPGPLMWQVTDVVELTNVSPDNLMLQLDSGPLRLDAGKAVRVTASALEQPAVKALVDRGAITSAAVPKRR
jgi:hypothetical protein